MRKAERVIGNWNGERKERKNMGEDEDGSCQGFDEINERAKAEDYALIR